MHAYKQGKGVTPVNELLSDPQENKMMRAATDTTATQDWARAGLLQK